MFKCTRAIYVQRRCLAKTKHLSLAFLHIFFIVHALKVIVLRLTMYHDVSMRGPKKLKQRPVQQIFECEIF